MVKDAPQTVYYVPNFITEEEEEEILKNVYNVPLPKWTCLKNRRLQDWGGVPHKNGMIQEAIPKWLQKYMQKVSALQLYGTFQANHVLINEYKPGQGIMPHLDGMLFYPTVATISCGSHSVLEFMDVENRRKVCDVLLERCSLVILQDDMYEKYMHSISETLIDKITNSYVNLNLCKERFEEGQSLTRGTRISLTIRAVPKVCKLKLLK